MLPVCFILFANSAEPERATNVFSAMANFSSAATASNHANLTSIIEPRISDARFTFAISTAIFEVVCFDGNDKRSSRPNVRNLPYSVSLPLTIRSNAKVGLGILPVWAANDPSFKLVKSSFWKAGLLASINCTASASPITFSRIDVALASKAFC